MTYHVTVSRDERREAVITVVAASKSDAHVKALAAAESMDWHEQIVADRSTWAEKIERAR